MLPLSKVCLTFLLVLGLLLPLTFAQEGPPAAALPPNKKKPNLLLVLSDQHSYDMVGANGNTQVITPHLNQFAQQGLRFTHAFTNQPVCTPFRGMLMSGLHPLKNGAFHNDVPLLPNQTKLLGEILKEQGYQTAYIGKWHLLGGNRNRPIPAEMRYGFDQLMTDNCHVDFRAHHAFFWNEHQQKQFFKEWEVYAQTRQALAFLDSIDPAKPFALLVSWHPPHDWGKEKGEDGKMHYRYETLPELMALYKPDSLQLRPGLAPSPDRTRMYHGYMAMISGVDRAFGLLLEKLAQNRQATNTLTIFSADHGDMLESSGAVLPKQYPHDYSSRIPLFMKFPDKLKPGTTSNLLIGALDFMPSILGLLGIASDQAYDGQDHSAAILSGREKEAAFVPLWNFDLNPTTNNNWRGLVTKEYTFAMAKPGNAGTLANVLFDRQKDPHQLTNLFHNPAYAAVKDSLRQLTFQWMRTHNDQFFGAQEFQAAKPKGGWAYNLTQRPIDLLSPNKR